MSCDSNLHMEYMIHNLSCFWVRKTFKSLLEWYVLNAWVSSYINYGINNLPMHIKLILPIKY